MLLIQNLSKNYYTKSGEIKAISNINLEIQEGEFISIIGPSGCGKSTLLSIMAGLTDATSGKISINNVPIKKQIHIGYMLQKDHLFPWRTIEKNILLGLEIQKKINKTNIEYTNELIEKYGLSEFKKNRPSELSGGMRQRAALIRTLATRPQILLLDEPFSALDYQTRLNVSLEVQQILKTEGKTAILVTHDIAEAISLSDRIVVLTQRPSTILSIHNIEMEQNAVERRQMPLFSKYFEKIWKELQNNEDY